MKKLMTVVMSALCAAVAFNGYAGGGTISGCEFRHMSTVSFPGYTDVPVLTNFPALIRLKANSPAGFSYADCAKETLRFADADGNLIPHEIDTWDAEGESLVWVSVPELKRGTRILMCYDPVGVPPAVTASDVWDRAGYQGVYHLNEESGAALDSTSAGRSAANTTPANATRVAEGAIGAARLAYKTTAGRYEVTGLKRGTTFTASYWLNVSKFNQWMRIFGASGVEIQCNNSVSSLTFNTVTTGFATFSIDSAQDDWVHLVLAFDGGQIRMFSNGRIANRSNLSAALPEKDDAMVWFGNVNNSSTGACDEMRVLDGVRPDAWYVAEYSTVADAAFAAFDEPEPWTATAETLDPEIFNRHVAITFSGYAGTTALANFPALIRLKADSPAGFSYAHCRPETIRFADADGNLIPHEIDTWDVEGESSVWVSIPELTKDTMITMYFDPPAAELAKVPRVNAADVWSRAGYAVVHHLGEADGTARDSTENGINATPLTRVLASSKYMVADANGVIGAGRKACVKTNASAYNDESMVVDRYDHLGLGGNFTISAWVKIESFGTWQRIIKAGGWEVQQGSVSQVQLKVGNSSSMTLSTPSMSGNWVHVALAFKGTSSVGYANGGQKATATLPAALADSTTNLKYGFFLVGSAAGSFDEFRIRSDQSSADWENAEYATAANADFITFGPLISPIYLDIGSDAEPPAVELDPGVARYSLEVGDTLRCTAPAVTVKAGVSYACLGYAMSVRDADGTWGAAVTNLGVCVCNYVQGETPARLTWLWSATPVPFDANRFKGRFTVTFPGYAGTTELASFPALVRISEASPAGFRYKNAARDSLRFLDEDGNVIPHEVESWDETGVSYVWVRLPRLTPVSEKVTQVTCYYGKTAADLLPTVKGGETWTGSDHIGVWHMAEESGVVADATDHALDAAPNADALAVSVAATGVIGNARQTGTKTVDGWLEVPSYASYGVGGSFTISCWAMAEAWGQWRRLFKSYTGSSGFEVESTTSAGTGFQVRGSGATNPTYSFSTVIGNWRHFAFVFDGPTVRVYVDGVDKGSKAVVEVVDSPATLCMGFSNFDKKAAYYGYLDEVRLRDAVDSADWLKAEYDTGANAAFSANGAAVSNGLMILLR